MTLHHHVQQTQHHVQQTPTDPTLRYRLGGRHAWLVLSAAVSVYILAVFHRTSLGVAGLIAAERFLWLQEVAATLRERLGDDARKVPTRVAPNLLVRAMALFDPSLRSVVGDMSLDDVLAKREQMNEVLRTKLDEVTERWGVKVTNVEIREIIPPPTVQEAMTRQMSAERTRRASACASTGTPLSLAYIIWIRSSGRGRLPVCVVRKRSVLRGAMRLNSTRRISRLFGRRL